MSSLIEKRGATALDCLPAHVAFGPQDHARIMLAAGKPGKIVLIDDRQNKWRSASVAVQTLPRMLAGLEGAADQYVSYHSFCWQRRTGSLARLGACYADLDYYTVDDLAHLPPEQMTIRVLEALQTAKMPAPSLIISSGRGLVVVWLHEFTSAKALPRWKAMQRALGDAMVAYGLDRNGSLHTACCRLIGSVNSKSRSLVRVTYASPHFSELNFRWPFDHLADEVLPFTRDELKAARQARKEKRVSKAAGPKPVTVCNYRTLHETVASDLVKLLEYRGGVLKPGHRNTWMFEYGTALAWLLAPEDLEAKLIECGERVAGWTLKETQRHLSAVLARSVKAVAGMKALYKSKTVDPRYRRSAATIVTALDISPDEMRGANLRVLVDAVVKRENATGRQRRSRRAAGVLSRATYERASTEALLSAAQDTMDQLGRAGSATELAATLSISTATARMRVKRARERLANANTPRDGL